MLQGTRDWNQDPPRSFKVSIMERNSNEINKILNKNRYFFKFNIEKEHVANLSLAGLTQQPLEHQQGPPHNKMYILYIVLLRRFWTLFPYLNDLKPIQIFLQR